MAALTRDDLNAHQKAALTYCADHEWKYKVDELCSSVGIARPSYYQWFEREAFRELWNAEANRWMIMQLGLVNAATVAGATSDHAPGNSRDRRLFYDKADKDFCPKSQTAVDLSGKVDLSRMTDEQLRAAARTCNPDTLPPAPDAPALPPPPGGQP